MAKHNEIGMQGELIAREYISKLGYEILDTNWRFERKEIDIIARKEELVLIIEVKTRSTEYFGNPEESVTRAKQNFLIKAADAYAQNLDFEAEIRYDIVAIILNEEGQKIRHIEDAFIPLIN